MESVNNKRAIVQYFLIYIMYMLHNSVLCNLNNRLPFTVFAFTIGIISMIFCKIKAPNRLYFTLGILLVNVIFVRFISGGVGITAFLFWASMLIITYAAYFLEPNSFVERYVNLVLVFASISLVLWALSQVIPGIVRKLTVFHIANPDYNYSVFDGLLLYITRDNVSRNVGVFGEPGLYQIVLNTALFFCLFEADKLSWVKNKRMYAIMILIITIISAQSTTGYIAAISIISVYLVSQRDKMKGRFILLAILLALFLLWNYFTQEDKSVISNVILEKMFNSGGGIDVNVDSGYWRMLMAKVSISSIKANPFGCGYDIARMLIKGQAEGQAGNALFVEIMALGLEFIGALIYSLLIPAFKNRKNILLFVLIVFLYINTTMAQASVFYPALVVLCIMEKKVSEKEKGNEDYVVCERPAAGNFTQF